MFSEAESEARYHVRLERYIKDIEIEVEALKNLVTGHVLPAAYRQLALLAKAGVGKAVKERAREDGRGGGGPGGHAWPTCRPRRRSAAGEGT